MAAEMPIRARSMPAHCGKICAERLVLRQIKNEFASSSPILWQRAFGHFFQLCFLLTENGFVPGLGHIAGSGGEGDSVMLEAIPIMLSLSSCALVVVAFWGSEVLGSEWRSRH